MTVEHVPRRPVGPPSMFMRWETLLFLHWPIDEASVRPLVPEALELDLFEGRAWIGLIPFTMRRVRHRFSPGLPTATDFLECNVRTYVVKDGVPGVWFFSLDATSRLAVWGARSFWNLNYIHSRMSCARRNDGTLDYEVRRRKTPDVRMRCAWKPGPMREPARPGDLEHFLTERYALYSVDRHGKCRRGRIWHEPWPLREASVRRVEDGLIAAAGLVIDFSDEPLAMCADAIDVEAWALAPA